MLVSFPGFSPSRSPNHLLAPPVPSVRAMFGVGEIGWSASPGGDRHTCESVWLVFPLFSPSTNRGGNWRTKEAFSIPDPIPLSGSRGRGSSVHLPQPASLLPFLASDLIEVPLQCPSHGCNAERSEATSEASVHVVSTP